MNQRAINMEGSIQNLKKTLFGIPVSAITRIKTVNEVISAAKKKVSWTVAFLPVHSMMVAQEDVQHKEALCNFDIVAPDGQPIRWALNHFHKCGLTERVYGPDVTLDVCKQAETESLAVYFYGSTNDVLQKLQQNLNKLFPNLVIAGIYCPAFGRRDGADIADDIKKIRDSNADILFVGLGCPKQELFVYQNIYELGIPTLAVGAAFDFHAGTLAQAPCWMQERGLEWVYRFIQEPRRLFKRYFYYNSWFLWLVTKETFKKLYLK